MSIRMGSWTTRLSLMGVRMYLGPPIRSLVDLKPSSLGVRKPTVLKGKRLSNVCSTSAGGKPSQKCSKPSIVASSDDHETSDASSATNDDSYESEWFDLPLLPFPSFPLSCTSLQEIHFLSILFLSFLLAMEPDLRLERQRDYLRERRGLGNRALNERPSLYKAWDSLRLWPVLATHHWYCYLCPFSWSSLWYGDWQFRQGVHGKLKEHYDLFMKLRAKKASLDRALIDATKPATATTTSWQSIDFAIYTRLRSPTVSSSGGPSSLLTHYLFRMLKIFPPICTDDS